MGLGGGGADSRRVTNHRVGPPKVSPERSSGAGPLTPECDSEKKSEKMTPIHVYNISESSPVEDNAIRTVCGHLAGRRSRIFNFTFYHEDFARSLVEMYPTEYQLCKVCFPKG